VPFTLSDTFDEDLQREDIELATFEEPNAQIHNVETIASRSRVVTSTVISTHPDAFGPLVKFTSFLFFDLELFIKPAEGFSQEGFTNLRIFILTIGIY
jgi:hypothetical protein